MENINNTIVRKEVIVSIPNGLRPNALTLFIQKATEFNCTIRIVKDDKSINAKSFLGVYMLDIHEGETVVLTAESDNEAEALKALEALASMLLC